MTSTLTDTRSPQAPRETKTTELPKGQLDPVKLVAGFILAALFAASIWSMVELRINLASLIDSSANAQRFVQRMFPLDFPSLGETAAMLWETIAIVLLATILGIAISIPIATAAAWNTTRGAGAQGFARFFIVVARAIPDLVLAIIFFRLFGLGGLPGVLAMGLHSVGMVGKLYADSLETLPTGPATAMAANGATRLQQVVTGYVPNWMPHLVSIGMYRFDINLRTSVLLGYVGVGGIGFALANSLRAMQYKRAMALALIVLIVCILVEMLSGAIRSAMHGESGGPFSWATSKLGSKDAKPAGPVGINPPWTPNRIGRALAFTLVGIIVILAFAGARIDLIGASAGLVKFPETVGHFFPPMGGELLPEVAYGMLVTIQIALASTLLGSLLAIPMGVLAARNVFPNRALNTTFRVIIVCVRAIPDVILAIIMVVITGLGSVAGTLALTVGAIGMLGKLVADALEETELGPQAALRANGATRLQVLFAATIRQVFPAVISHVMYVLDSHIRAATLLGVVGAGGIGFLLLNAARVMEYPAITTIIIAILLVVLIVEGLSMFVRKAIR